MVFYSRSRSCPVCRFVCDYDIQNIRMPEMQNRIQAEMVSAFGLCSHQPKSPCQMPEVRKDKLL